MDKIWISPYWVSFRFWWENTILHFTCSDVTNCIWFHSIFLPSVRTSRREHPIFQIKVLFLFSWLHFTILHTLECHKAFIRLMEVARGKGEQLYRNLSMWFESAPWPRDERSKILCPSTNNLGFYYHSTLEWIISNVQLGLF